MYLKPINNASELNKNIYIEEMNNRLKYELTILGFLPSQGNFENVKLTRTNIFRNQLNDDETWHMYRQELNEWRSLSLLKIQRQSNIINFKELKVNENSWQSIYDYANSNPYNPDNMFADYFNGEKIVVENLILDNTSGKNFNTFKVISNLSIKKINGSNTVNLADFIDNKWPIQLLRSFDGKVFVPTGTYNFEKYILKL